MNKYLVILCLMLAPVMQGVAQSADKTIGDRVNPYTGLNLPIEEQKLQLRLPSCRLCWADNGEALMHLNKNRFFCFAVAERTAYKVPDIKVTKAKGPNFLQTLGFVGMAVAKATIYPSAPDRPDL